MRIFTKYHGIRLLRAIKEKNIVRVQEEISFLTQDEILHYGKKALNNAIKDGELQIVKFLLNKNIPTSEIDDEAIQFCVYNGYLDVIIHLHSLNIPLDFYSCYNLSIASRSDNLDMVKFFVNTIGCLPTANNYEPIKWAEKYKQHEIQNYLCELIIINAPNKIPDILPYISDELKIKYPQYF